eukprot:NODE_9195_length_484_cov_4.645977_g8116_i0.p2 GENE.NODE_9195_length_484_cov_4.645977_g8116_i0~~NODE_9195_length_484_cov_4.645977_g8116_i0.p2  ORF type:complete len:107 (+),score=14.13 NODE_9195_length_484_cov_4.645977_g8116_i0:69-389(+)
MSTRILCFRCNGKFLCEPSLCCVCFLDNASFSDPGGVYKGKDQIQEFIAGLYKANPDVAFTVRNICVDGNNAVIEFKLRMGDTTLQGTDIIEWEGGKIKELRAYLY